MHKSDRAISAEALESRDRDSVDALRSAVESFAFDSAYGEVSAQYKTVDLESVVRRLSDPATASETIHWGRNYLYKTHLDTATERLDVVVKQFRNSGLRNRLRRYLGGSKAARSWRIAQAFEQAGLKTAECVMLIESSQSEGPSFFVTRHLGDVIEARYVLRAANSHLEKEQFPDLDFDAFFRALGQAVRQMHEAGFFHRDLSIGNILLPMESQTPTAEDLSIIDLNRARHRQRLSLWQKTRDLCRLAIYRPEQQRLFLQAYWETENPTWTQLTLYNACHYGFRFKVDGKKKLRTWTRWLGQWVMPRQAHAHIPDAPTDASARDKIVWDHLSDQPHQHASRLEKLWVRLADTPSHARQTATFFAALPRIVRRYREIKQDLYQRPKPWDGVGVCLRPFPEAPDLLLTAIEDLGVQKILLRLHPWDDDHDAEENLARELQNKGFELAFALPQNRDLIRDPNRWRDKVVELAERFTPFGHHFQIGQAINRSKWGIWRYNEYLELAWSAAEILKKYPGVEILGPAVIDFEFHVTASILNSKYKDLHFDILSSLLYVDRRGAPESSQLGFDTIDKIVLQRAIAETSRLCGPRSWVTEVNWPLWEGPHSPAGKSVSVDPDTQADYLARYYLLALATGAVERVYWWQLVARGYGLIAPRGDAKQGRLELIRRPSFLALKTLAQELQNSIFIGPLPSLPDTHLYHFRSAEGQERVAAWSSNRRQRAVLPKAAKMVVDIGGQHLSMPESREIELTSSVRYFHL